MIRHGEPDYKPCDDRIFIGHGRDLAPLTDKGIEQAKKVAKDPLLRGAKIILSSPYTRALQTAAFIASELKLDIKIEVDLREWQPDLTFTYKTSEEAFALGREYDLLKGIYPQGETRKWESTEMLSTRAVNCLKPYSNIYDKVVIVTHGMLMRQFINEPIIPHCGMIDFNFTGS